MKTKTLILAAAAIGMTFGASTYVFARPMPQKITSMSIKGRRDHSDHDEAKHDHADDKDHAHARSARS